MGVGEVVLVHLDLDELKRVGQRLEEVVELAVVFVQAVGEEVHFVAAVISLGALWQRFLVKW